MKTRRYADIPWLWAVRIADDFLAVVCTREEVSTIQEWARNLAGDPLVEPPPLPVPEHQADVPFRRERWSSAAQEFSVKVRMARMARGEKP